MNSRLRCFSKAAADNRAESLWIADIAPSKADKRGWKEVFRGADVYLNASVVEHFHFRLAILCNSALDKKTIGQEMEHCASSKRERDETVPTPPSEQRTSPEVF